MRRRRPCEAGGDASASVRAGAGSPTRHPRWGAGGGPPAPVEKRLRLCGAAGHAKPAATHRRQFAPGRGPQRGTRVGVQAVGPRRLWKKALQSTFARDTPVGRTALQPASTRHLLQLFNANSIKIIGMAVSHPVTKNAAIAALVAARN